MWPKTDQAEAVRDLGKALALSEGRYSSPDRPRSRRRITLGAVTVVPESIGSVGTRAECITSSDELPYHLGHPADISHEHKQENQHPSDNRVPSRWCEIRVEANGHSGS